eukprot:CAMPEP_0172373704 /NCGR_PEP_ID=MMETSP1060-20121228/52886_1 /TAXON_ID=37318 /ORGANISM="Pseudo-nitzschia pungens, Strain cf. cingulata" /LENGTH=834 /DNA_ID=CAMNT_0013100113 /DNA_START=170 /DNA_END=2671 /DNA_ORIENTATION=-
MGCNHSKQGDVDFSEVDRLREEMGLNDPKVESFDAGNQRKPSIIAASSGLVENWAKQVKPIVDNMILADATPKLSKLVVATAAVVMGTKFSHQQGAHHLRDVFVPPLENVSTFQAPVYPKTQTEKKLIRDALKTNFVFGACSDRELRTIVDAFEESKFGAGDKIIVEGDVGDYFYLLKEGKARFEVHGKLVGHAEEGTTFGELALLYSSPRGASVIAETDVTIYRVDQNTFRYIMQSQTMKTDQAKKELLQGIGFLKILDPSVIDKLVHTMIPRVFEAGESITKKGDAGDTLYVIQEGNVRVTEVNIHSVKKENQELGPGDHFGETALLHKEEDARCSTVVALTKVFTFSVDRYTFERVVGDIVELAIQAKEKAILAEIPILKKTGFSKPVFGALSALFVEETFPPNSIIMTTGEKTSPNLYIIRSGKVMLQGRGIELEMQSGSYFGEDVLRMDIGGFKTTKEYIAGQTIRTLDETVVVGALSIASFRNVVDTTSLGTKKLVDYKDSSILMDDLIKHSIIGAGTFGQVWLVSHEGTDGDRRPYAFKIQSKHELIEHHQAKGVVEEKKIMEKLNHPFLMRLAATYQDKKFIYMLLGFVQGGELFSIIYSKTRNGIDEKNALFYASGILEGLSHMHRCHILYRDLKPENVMIDEDGYPVIIDFGFAKYVTGKTYTLCGTPLYIAPEVIQNRGHDKAADHWSFGVLTYEMMEGTTPFYVDGMNQIQLYRRICRLKYEFPPDGKMSSELKDLFQRLFVSDPAQRIGSLANGINEIYGHSWFRDIDFGKLRKKELDPPWIPEVKDPFDTANFESWDHLRDKSKGKEPTISAAEQRIFNW